MVLAVGKPPRPSGLGGRQQLEPPVVVDGAGRDTREGHQLAERQRRGRACAVCACAVCACAVCARVVGVGFVRTGPVGPMCLARFALAGPPMAAPVPPALAVVAPGDRSACAMVTAGATAVTWAMILLAASFRPFAHLSGPLHLASYPRFNHQNGHNRVHGPPGPLGPQATRLKGPCATPTAWPGCTAGT